MTPPKKAKPRAVGRPWENPPGARPRTIRMTDAEWAAVKAFLAERRGAAGGGPRPK